MSNSKHTLGKPERSKNQKASLQPHIDPQTNEPFAPQWCCGGECGCRGLVAVGCWICCGLYCPCCKWVPLRSLTLKGVEVAGTHHILVNRHCLYHRNDTQELEERPEKHVLSWVSLHYDFGALLRLWISSYHLFCETWPASLQNPRVYR
jgi:hypothetical protein